MVEDVFDAATLDAVRDGLYAGRELVQSRIGIDRLQRAGELGVVRVPMLASDAFFRLLEAPEILEIVDATVSPTAILHLQNGFVLPPAQPADGAPFQRSFHRDFPRVLNGYLCSINTLIAIDEFTAGNGATIVVPGTHQSSSPWPEEVLARDAVAAECGAGSMIVFDSTLWHAAGQNSTAQDRCAVNQQFTRSYFKQQMDYVRCLGAQRILSRQERTQQLLGWYTRIPDSLEQYYSEERVYRAGQG